MTYDIQRVLVIDDKVFKVNDFILINGKIVAKLKAIYFVDEYRAEIVTTEGTYLLDDMISLDKIDVDEC